MNGNLITKHISKAAAAKLLNIDPSSISNCALGRRRSAGGFKWSYNNPKEAKELKLSISRF